MPKMELKDGRLGIFVDGDDVLGSLHAGGVLTAP